MQYRQLGKGGPRVSVIGLGAWPIGGGMGRVDEKNSIATVRMAIDNGITFLDTAQAYRTSEATLGRALKDGYRERCFLATKVSHRYSKKDIESAIENSLRNLNVDFVDLYQIHSWNPRFSVEESLETMVRLREQGKIRYIGVSNFNVDQLQEASGIASFHSNQPRYNMFHRKIEAEDILFCEKTGIGILAHSPLAKGLLTGRYDSTHIFSNDDERFDKPQFQGELFSRYLAVANELKMVALDKGISLVQLAIAWILRLSAVTCVLVGAKNPKQVMEHEGAAEIVISKEELVLIESILERAPPG